jgi:hypothetical protein
MYDHEVRADEHNYVEASGNSIPIEGKWKLSFVHGGPTLPGPIELDSLMFWTNTSNDELKKFSGTGKYSIAFQRPEFKSSAWLLDLGKVKETARVFLNGERIGTLIGPSYTLYIDDDLLKDSNILEVEVSNLMANRIADLDRRGVFWKKFYNVNFPARLAENRKDGIFDASSWNPRDSGLGGPVTITPIESSPHDN